MTGSTADARTICRMHRADAAFMAMDVALLLPFACTKEEQMAESAGTKRTPKIAQVLWVMARDPATSSNEAKRAANVSISAC